MSDKIHIIACSVFKDAVTYLTDRMTGHPFSFSYLPSSLHLYPRELEEKLLSAVRETRPMHSGMGCLYGQCFEDIDHALLTENVVRIPCCHCHEMLLGHQRYLDIVAQTPGTFFAEKELLLDFDELCRIPLELDDPDLRALYFKHYRQLVYIRQPLDPDLDHQAQSVAELLNLKLIVEEADYTELEVFLNHLALR